ncbi:hypothetical protein OF385_13705 [Glutamicibacter sp. JL.03c]|uniref:hypothetical protein n=1 Tax=Glutamicibacter sp. JL.03c TaxID=2984842 RepID=UPI0021F6CDA8|nr:hypothetical protein [Glutamicibacter sp. JL.03c]UYQ77060.1 hypothetical protein OF385_13705 [Glutamicibacter sp. JL.03c]
MPNQPLVSIDAVPLIVLNDALHVVTARREWEPYAAEHALPGVLLNSHERLREAVARALADKAGVTAETEAELVAVFDDFERDERGPTLSMAHLVILEHLPGDERAKAEPLSNLPQLPFDHNAIIARAAGMLLDSLWVNLPLTRRLLGEQFTTADVVARMKELAAAASRPEPVVNNVGRALAANKAVEKLPAIAVGTGRPPASWKWVRSA